MRKSITRSAKPRTEGGFLPASDDSQEAWYKREWRLIALLSIMVVAFVIRFIFAYGISAGNDFALSGGTDALSHAHIIESIVNGSFAFTDPALNYPYGSVVTSPVLMDVVLAGFAGLATMLGVSAGTAAAGTLAFAAPIFAALTCWPVYLIGRKMFDDEKIGLLAALLYAFFALMIMTTAFSNGTAIAFAGFLFAFMIYFTLKALEGVDKDQPTGLFGVFANKGVLKHTIIAGIFFLLIALSWSQFRVILLMFIVFLVAQAIIDRIRGREVMPAVLIYSTIIAIGLLIALPYYLAAGLWDFAFSGSFVLGMLVIALSLFFAYTAKRTWVLMLPVTIMIAAAVLVALWAVVPDLFFAVIYGNSMYINELMSNLASQSTRTTMSSMAAYFGWVTLWLPLLMFLYMLYKYRKNADSRKYTFIMMWIPAMFCIGWFSSAYATVAGPAFAVASAAVILMVMRMVDLKTYYKDMRGNGIKFAAKKAMKPIPLATVIAMAALILAPNIVYAVDASTPTNSDGDGYFGGLGYTIMTDDINSINKMWSEFRDEDKEGALIAWLGNSTNAVSHGGFDSVMDAYGNGASAMSAVLLANSSAAATATMALRLMMGKELSDYQQIISDAGLSFNTIKGYIDDPSSAVRYIKENIEQFSGISTGVTEENAVYLVITKYITSTITEPQIDILYEGICNRSHESIRYVAVDVTMLPLYYGDNSYFSTVAYLGSYNLGTYGAPTQFFSYDTYTGYATYTDALYSTLIWKTLIGMSPAEAGFSSANQYLNALASSDGTVKANPAHGLANYNVAYWHVYYNPDSSATGTSAGWVDMAALGPEGAIALQAEQGGLINYINGVVVLEYDSSSTSTVSGTVSYASAAGSAGAKGIQVSVFAESATGSSGSGELGYVKRATAFTDENGRYSISVPSGADYYVAFSSGTSTTATGSIIETRWNMTSANADLTIPPTTLSGTVTMSDGLYTEDCYVVIEGRTSGMKYKADVVAGTYGTWKDFNNDAVTSANIMPDTYGVTLYSPTGTVINSATVTVNAGGNAGYQITATSGTITVTATTDVGAMAPAGTVISARDNLTGKVFTGTVGTDGKAIIKVVPATYIVYATGSKISTANPSSSVTSNGSSSASLVVYDAKNISLSGAPAGSLVSIMSYGFTTSSSTSSVSVPAGRGNGNETYTAYAVSGNSVYYGISGSSSISLTQAAGYSVTGTVKNSEGGNFTGTVSFIMLNGATFIFTADADGKFDVVLPAGSYTMYIYGSSSASISELNVSGDADLGSISTSKSRTLTVTLNYSTAMSSPSTRGLGYVDITYKTTISGTEYTIVGKTDSSGRTIFTLPQNTSGTASTQAINNTLFNMPARTYDLSSGTSNTTTTWTIAVSEEATTSGTYGYVKPVPTVTTGGVSVSLKPYHSTLDERGTATSFANLQPGQYTATSAGSTGNYFSGTVYVYPGVPIIQNITATNVATVHLTGIAGTDKISVTPTDETQGKYFADPDDPLTYYVERTKGFYFTATSGDGDQERIGYGTVTNASGTVTLNLAGSIKAQISGYAGVNADGTLTMTYGSVKVPFTVTDGTFDITVPSGTAMTLTADLSQTIGDKVYTYTGSRSLTAAEVADKAEVRFHSTSSAPASAVPDLFGEDFSFVNGVGRFTLEIKNTGTTGTTFNVRAGSAWVLDKAYSIYIAAGATSPITIEGRYDPAVVGAGNPNLSVTVASINGTSVGTYVVDASAFPVSGPGVTISDTFADISGTEKASADAVNNFEYLYAVTITNDDSYLKTVSITAAPIGAGGNWIWVYSDKDGGNIKSSAPNEFNVNGFGTAVIYVKVMSTDAAQTNVPNVNITVTMVTADQTLKTNGGGTSTGTSVTFSGVGPQEAKLETQNTSVTGDNIFNEPSDIPLLTLALLALCIVLVITMMWLGMKKGVFVRKR